MTAPGRGLPIARAWRRALACACAAALPGLAHAQFVGTLGVDDVDRYRGTGTGADGPVLRASAMADLASGAYGGIAGLWRTRDAGLARAEAIVGWSGRLQAGPTLSPEWGWDLALHRTHAGGAGARDFTELMAGLLAPDWTLRTWYSPHYFGGALHTFYTELDASHAFDARWHAFAHLGWLHYGPAPRDDARLTDRVDTSVGIGATLVSWEIHLARDALVGGQTPAAPSARDRRAAWVVGASVSF